MLRKRILEEIFGAYRINYSLEFYVHTDIVLSEEMFYEKIVFLSKFDVIRSWKEMP